MSFAEHFPVYLQCLFYFLDEDVFISRMASAALPRPHLHGGERHQGLVGEGGAAEGSSSQFYGTLQ